MIDYLKGPGFLGTGASLGADLSLVAIIAAAALFTAGFVLVRTGRVQAHRWAQTTGVVLSLVPALIWMVYRYGKSFVPGLPGSFLSNGIDFLTTVHAITGAVAIGLGIWVATRAHRSEGRRENTARFRTSMRWSYSVYVLATVYGVALYVWLYV